MQKEIGNNSIIVEPPKKSNKTLIIVIVVSLFLIIAVCVLAYLGYNYFKNIEQEQGINETDNETPINPVPGNQSQDINQTPVVTNTTPPIRAPSSPGGSSPGGSSGGTPSCTAKTCSDYSGQCGTFDDNCDGTITCSCDFGYYCNSTGTCVVTPNCTTNANCTDLNGTCGLGFCNTSNQQCEVNYNSSTTVCRTSNFDCDAIEMCTGSLLFCPDDINKTDDTECSGGTCQGGECIVLCTPDCSGKECGDDKCGGSCGTCSQGYCDNGLCSELHNFAFLFSDTGLLLELNWSDKKVVLDERYSKQSIGWVEHYLHSNTDGKGWEFSFENKTIVKENQNDINYIKESEEDNGVRIKAETNNLKINDEIIFTKDNMIIRVNITNKLNEEIFVTVPLHLGGLQLNNDYRYRLRSDNGGYIEDWRGDSAVAGNYLAYPDWISVYSPVSVLWDNEVTIGKQYLTELYLPTVINFTEAPKYQYSELMRSFINTEMNAGETKEFVILFSFAEGGDENNENWKKTLTPYKEWFYETYGNEPDYCPTGSFGYHITRNDCGYRLFNWNHGNCVSTYDPSLPDRRWLPGTELKYVLMDLAGKFESMQKFDIKLYGVWGTALHTIYLTNDTDNRHEFGGTVDLIDPNLDVGEDPEKITELVNLYKDDGRKLFWYVRPCADIPGADIIQLPDGSYEFIKGTPSGYRDVDLTNLTNRDRQFNRIDFLASKGVEGFYFDATSCPGDEEFIEYCREQFKQRYGKDIFILKEGARDRDALMWPQIPFVKTTFLNKEVLLIDFLVPNGTYYVGPVNNGLTKEETEYFIKEKGFQPILGTLSSYSQWVSDEQWTKDLLTEALKSQRARQIQGCSEIPDYSWQTPDLSSLSLFTRIWSWIKGLIS